MDQFCKTLGEDHPGVEVLDEREIATLFTLQKRGWTIKEMARALGWSRNTIRNWLRRGPETARPAMGRPKKLASEEAWVPWWIYLNSCRRSLPGRGGRSWCLRSMAWIPFFSSMESTTPSLGGLW